MSDQYTPTTEQVETLVRSVFVQGVMTGEFDESQLTHGMECFARWLASVKAGAWDAAIAEAAEQGTIQIPENPYREQETP